MGMGMGPPPMGGGPPGASGYQQQQRPPVPGQGYGPGPGPRPGPSMGPGQGQGQEEGLGLGFGLIGKFKSFFSTDNDQHAAAGAGAGTGAPRRFAPPGPPGPAPPSPGGMYGQPSYPSMYGLDQSSPVHPPSPSAAQVLAQSQPGPPLYIPPGSVGLGPGHGQQTPYPPHQQPLSSPFQPHVQPPPSFPGPVPGQYPPGPGPVPGPGPGPSPYPDLQQQQQQQGYPGGAGAVQTPDYVSMMSPDPQVFVVDDCIVFIAKPKEYYRKKMQMTAAGPLGLQVFADFERVLTKFKTEDGTSRCLGSAEVLEGSQAISARAAGKLRAIAEEYNALSNGEGMDDAAFEEFTQKCQAVIASEGQLHIANVAPVTREYLPRMPLRDGWGEAFQSLTYHGIPLYVFSSGYGDIVAQAMVQSGGLDGGQGQGLGQVPQGLTGGYNPSPGPNMAAAATLPQNMRIISNFFRTAPDGSVRAFSSPIVHERNKNATTASRHMGMPIPERPFALVFGSHEDDVSMTDGCKEIKDQISVGFLELTEDLPQRISSFMNSFDAVVVGDSSFHFCKSVIEDILQTTSVKGKVGGAGKQQQRQPSFLERNVLGFPGDMHLL